MKKPRNQPTIASFSHGGAAVFGSGVRPVERDELDVAGLCWARRIWLGIREERTEEGERERVGGVLKREKDLFYFFPCERERERERERREA